MPIKTKVCIIVDSLQPGYGRMCFWPLLQEQLPELEFNLASFPESRDARQFLDFRKYHCIVFSWDVLNNDYWMRGEVTRAMTARGARSFLPNWVKEGGLLILEAQCSHWKPNQEAYDSVWSPSGLSVSAYGYHKATANNAFQIVKRYTKHPFLQEMECSRDYMCQGKYWKGEWFPRWYSGHAATFNAVWQRTHSGTFLNHRPEWLPLLKCSASGLPIMLARVHGRGAVVATTMHLASSGQVQLIKNMLCNWREDVADPVNAYHRKVMFVAKPLYYAPRVLPLLILSGTAWAVGIWYFDKLIAGASGFLGFALGGLLTSRYYDDIAGALKIAWRMAFRSGAAQV